MKKVLMMLLFLSACEKTVDNDKPTCQKYGGRVHDIFDVEEHCSKDVFALTDSYTCRKVTVSTGWSCILHETPAEHP